MEIYYERPETTHMLGDLGRGDVFETGDNIYMRVEAGTTVHMNLLTGNPNIPRTAVVHLETGIVGWMEVTTLVTHLQAKLYAKIQI